MTTRLLLGAALLAAAAISWNTRLVSSQTPGEGPDCLSELANVMGADRTLMREWLELLRGPETFNRPMTPHDWRTFFKPTPDHGAERERLRAELAAEKRTCEAELVTARAELRRLAERVIKEREKSMARFGAADAGTGR